MKARQVLEHYTGKAALILNLFGSPTTLQELSDPSCNRNLQLVVLQASLIPQLLS